MIGICYFANGDKYEGEWCNDKMDGIGNIINILGTYYYGTGDKYEGEWLNGYEHGNGIKYNNLRYIPLCQWREV